MQRSLYSLILSDDVIRAIDRLAYEQGSSRSGLINQILADYVSYITPQARIRQIFDAAALAAAQNSALQLLTQPSASMLTMKSTIPFKYNPIIRYSVELVVAQGGYSGELRVSSRSQSAALLEELTRFFELWISLEQALLAKTLPPDSLIYEMTPGRFIRRLRVIKEGEIAACEPLGDAIGRYMNLFDHSMNLYFQNKGREQEVIRAMGAAYGDFLAHCSIPI